MFTIETQSEILSCWRALEGVGDQRIERTSSLARKCADGVAVSIRYDVTVVQIVPNFPRFLGKLRACANSRYQALSFPAHQEPGYEVKDQKEYLAPTISQRQYSATLI